MRRKAALKRDLFVGLMLLLSSSQVDTVSAGINVWTGSENMIICLRKRDGEALIKAVGASGLFAPGLRFVSLLARSRPKKKTCIAPVLLPHPRRSSCQEVRDKLDDLRESSYNDYGATA
jgi:hypothetical protein